MSSSATAAAGGTGNGGGKSNNYNSYSNLNNSNNNNNNQFNNPNLNTAAAASGGGGEVTARYESSDDDDLHLTSSSFAPRDPKLDEHAKKHLPVVEPSWQFILSFVKAAKEAVVEGNDDPNLTKWSKKYLPSVLDAVVKLQEHVVDAAHFDSIYCKLYDIVELPVQGRPCCGRKKNDDFLSNFRECNELVLTVLCGFASLRGGLYFKEEQFKDQYGNALHEFENQLIAVNHLLLDCSPTSLNGDYDNEEDAPVPAESKAKNWQEYIKTMITLKEKVFVKLKHEVIFWSQRLKSAINYVDPSWNSKEEKEILQLNFNSSTNSNNNQINNEKKSQMQADSTSLAAIQRKLRIFYRNRLLLSQSDAEDDHQQDSKFEDFFCNLRLKKRQQKEGEQQSATDGEFVSASHLPTRLRSAAHTVLVTGPGGAGKTVALKHICIQQGVEDSVIVFVPLKELRGMLKRIKSIEDIFENCSASVALSEEQIEAIVEKRIPVIFAFDGFDEVHNAQEEDKNIAHFLSDMIDPVKRKQALDPECRLLRKLIRDCDRVIISSREERIASANCNLDSAEARPLVDELAVQLWTNSEVERFCLRFFSNAFKKQEQEQQNQKCENEHELAKAARSATNDVTSSLASPLMDSWRGLPLAVTLLSQLRSSSSENSKNGLDDMSPARAYSLVLEMHWRRSEMRVADRLLRCKKQYVLSCLNDHKIDLDRGVTPELFELVLNSAAEASFKQLLSTNSNVTEISFSSSSSSSSNNKLPLWAALLRETGLIRVENNNSKATFSHRSWIEFLCARHAATSSSENEIEQIPWDQSKFASVWLLLADFAHSGTFEKSLSVQRFCFVVMTKYAEKVKETVKERERRGRVWINVFNVDKESGKASISLLARITNIIKPEELFSPLRLVTQTKALDFAKKNLNQLPKLIKRPSVSCSKCKTHFSEAPADWKCDKCNVFMWRESTSYCLICWKSFTFTWRSRTSCCGRCVCSDCVFEKERVPKNKYFCKTCVVFAITPVIRNASEDRKVNVLVEENLDENDSRIRFKSKTSSQKQTIAANSFTLHLRWLAELCVAEGALDCFKFIQEKYPEALFGVFQNDLEFAKSEILSPALARALDHLDRPSVSACVEDIINKYNVEVQLEDALRVNSLVGVTRAVKKMENVTLDASVQKDKERGKKILNLFSGAIAKKHFDVVAAMLRCRRDEKDRFLWCHQVISPQAVHFRLKYLFPQDLQFRVWCEEKKDFETSTLSDLEIDLSSNMQCEKFEVILSAAEQHLWFPFFHLFEEVVHHRSGTFSFTPSNSPGQLRVLDLTNNKNLRDQELAALVGKCSKLEKINLSYTKFGDASLRALATCASTLRSLKLAGNKRCTDAGVVALVSKCTQLEEINLSGFDTKFGDVTLRALAACASTLRSLNLCFNKSCTDVGVAALVSMCAQLAEINLSGSSFSGSTMFGDASLKALAASPSVTQQKNPTLVKIDLCDNQNVTDAGIDALKEAYGDFWTKVEVGTYGCKNITNK